MFRFLYWAIPLFVFLGCLGSVACCSIHRVKESTIEITESVKENSSDLLPIVIESSVVEKVFKLESIEKNNVEKSKILWLQSVMFANRSDVARILEMENDGTVEITGSSSEKVEMLLNRILARE